MTNVSCAWLGYGTCLLVVTYSRAKIVTILLEISQMYLAGDPLGRLAGDLDDLLPDLLLLLGEGDLLPLGGDLLLGDGDLLLPPPNPLLGGDLPPLGGDHPLPPLPALIGDLLLGLGLLLVTLGTNTGAAEISWPSIWPPSMCFMAFWAST